MQSFIESDPGKEEDEKVSPFARRWILAYVSFFGFVFLYATRVNISVAIICMVRSSTSNVTSLDNSTGLNVTSKSVNVVDEACGILEQASSTLQRAEFDWDKPTRSRILALYFYGYIFTQIPGGWLAGRYGARRVWGLGMFVNGLGTILTPVSARLNVYVLYAVRFIIGFAAGVSFPATHSLWGRWAPPLERSKLMSVCYAGPHVGTIVAFALSGYLCANGFDNGWGSIFYVFGAGNLVWVGLWLMLSADNPRKHKFISEKEIAYIERKIGYKTNIKTRSTPWLAMAKSGPLWAIILAHMCNNWTNYTLITVLPTFMKEVLKFDIRQNGVISSLPYVCHSVLAVLAGQLADIVRARTRLGTTRVRKVWQNAAFLSVAVFLVATGFINCENRMVAVVFLCAAVGCMGISKGAYMVNHVDIAPKYSGVLFGITNTVATVPGMIAPLVAGALTPNKTAEEWRLVLYICAGFLVAGALIFTFLASGETQPWNDHDDIELDVIKGKKSHKYVAIDHVKETLGEDH
ncbi:sialin-like [Haliotis rufescens]|uniref:sialin-like n=1 Tax=Haliotis rufescens TaxID=6454 RepID=UPI00201EEBB7|nr:sialin-like [Haliotis rufescens]